MGTLIKQLKAFNRKERYYLVAHALGNPDFRLDRYFRNQLSDIFRVEVPKDAFAAMDYHFDWIFASAFLSAPENILQADSYPKCASIVANQEDVDFIVAFPDDLDSEKYHLMLLEAKLDSSWSNKQFRSKAIRLIEIFGKSGERWKHIEPHFAVLSPSEPQRLQFLNSESDSGAEVEEAWFAPGGKPLWGKLEMPSALQKITRCTETLEQSSQGTHWRVESREKKYNIDSRNCAK